MRAFSSHGYKDSSGQLLTGLIDTGADYCAMPESYAQLLGHTIHKGEKSAVITGGGDANTSIHTCSFDILCPQTNMILHQVKEVKTHFIAGLPQALIGVAGFLNQFKLTIDYHENRFSLTKQK